MKEVIKLLPTTLFCIKRHVMSKKFKEKAFSVLGSSGLLKAAKKLFGFKGAIVLMYHNVSKDVFRKHALFLKKHFEVVSVSEIVSLLESGKNFSGKCAVTFDDGLNTIYTEVFPSLKELNIPITVFLPVDLVGSSNKYLSWNKVREMNSSKLVSFGSHTKRHSNLSQVSEKQFEEEVLESKKEIEKKIRERVDFFSPPFGIVSEDQLNFLKNHYKAVFSITQGDNFPENSFYIKRLPVFKEHNAMNLYFITGFGKY